VRRGSFSVSGWELSDEKWRDKAIKGITMAGRGRFNVEVN
jgi:hypothetical protein